MKKKSLWLTAILLLLLPGCAGVGRAPLFAEGVYALHAKSFTYLELAADRLPIAPNIANLTDTKPDSLKVDFDDTGLRDVVYGSFRLGNNDRKTWFLMGRDRDGNWSDFYIDRNLDYHLSAAERVTGLERGQGNYQGYQTVSTYSMAPLLLQVSYQGANRDYTRKVGFFIEILDLMKHDARDTFVKAYAAGFFEGQIPIRTGKTTRTFQFQLIDADSNGCYNDFGRDLVYVDTAADGYFRDYEKHPLAEYFGPARQQRQIALPPYPAKIAVTQVNEDIDLAALEPAGDPGAPTVTDHPAAGAQTRGGEAAPKGADGK